MKRGGQGTVSLLKKSEKRWLTKPFSHAKINKSSGNGREQNLGVFPSGQWGQTVNLLHDRINKSSGEGHKK